MRDGWWMMLYVGYAIIVFFATIVGVIIGVIVEWRVALVLAVMVALAYSGWSALCRDGTHLDRLVEREERGQA